eukprot:scaffold1004_cov269-Pinguiococcus_pyrenoidosus.AAC.21
MVRQSTSVTPRGLGRAAAPSATNASRCRRALLRSASSSLLSIGLADARVMASAISPRRVIHRESSEEVRGRTGCLGTDTINNTTNGRRKRSVLPAARAAKLDFSR